MTDIAPTFVRTLVTDVIAASEHLAQTDDQTRRRNFIRASFAAIEGLVWLLRSHVLSVADSMGYLDPLDVLALRDIGYSVNDNGVLRSTSQYMPLTTAIKYAIRRAQAIAPDIAVDYGDAGWSKLLEAIKVRHRVTHPKTADDLIITSEELESSSRALAWLLAVVQEAMQATTASFRSFNEEFGALHSALKRGDPESLKLYNELLNRDEQP